RKFGAHQGITKTVDKIRHIFHWPNVKKFVAKKIKECNTCIRAKYDQSGQKGKLSSYIISEQNHQLFIDLAGPLPRSKMGYQYILICVDGFTRIGQNAP
ncbi:integrase zinc binding domain-containing protein, partial [Klebsiella pneumoniae]|uniref:integrase zinc binding domain-containing protein n=1 Tax=Klebsiella pneumoniae TaxID=573 RepID=UPI0040555223